MLLGRGRWTPTRAAAAFACLFLSAGASALDPKKLVTQYGLDTWQEELPQSTVQSLIQTREGYLWLSTYEGIVRFDGVKFGPIDPARPGLLQGTSVLALHEGADATVWGATYQGLARIRNAEVRMITTADRLPSNVVTAVVDAPDGTIWVGTDRGLVRLRGGEVPALPGPKGVPPVRSLLMDRHGGLFIGTDSGLLRWHDGKLERYGVADGLPSDVVRPLHQDPDGRIYVGTNGGLARFEKGRFTSFTKESGLTDPFIRAIHTDRDRNLWVGTENAGLFRLREDGFEQLSTKQGLAHDHVRSLCEDREGNLWVGTSSGLARLVDGKFTNWGVREGLPNDFVRTIVPAGDGSVLIGTDGGGLTRLDGRKITSLTTDDGLPNNAVRSVLRARDGSVWVGTRGGVAQVVAGKVAAVWTSAEGLTQDSVRVLLEDRSGTIWIGTEGGGIDLLSGATLRAIRTSDGLPSEDVRALLEDPDGSVWIGTFGGLARVRNGRVVSVLHVKDGLPSDVVFALLRDPDGTLWVGTDGGLARVHPNGRISTYTTANGLFDNRTFLILDDGAGNFWLTSNKGITKVARTQLDELDSGKRKTLEVTVFGRSDGLRTNQCNGSSQPAGARTADGRLWFPTPRGVAVLDPARMSTNLLPPPVVIEEVLSSGKAIPFSSGVRLPPRHGELEIRYTGLSLRAPERIRFRYRLEGLAEAAWVDAGSRRAAFYTNLPPGDFRFRVEACNEDGLWSSGGASFRFAVEPHWYETPWFWALALVAAIGAVWGAVRLRVRSLESRNRTLRDMVRERTAELARTNLQLAVKVEQLEESERRAHESEAGAVEANRAKSVFLSNMSHELRTPLNSIIGFSQILVEKLEGQIPERHRRFLTNILGSGQHLLRIINDLLDLSKIEEGRMELFVEPVSIQSLAEAVRGLVRGMADPRKIEIRCDVPESIPVIRADPAKLKQILVNLVANAVKFSSDGTRVDVVVRQLEAIESPLGEASLRIDVVDEGIGIALADQELIFEEFRQADSGTTRRYEGTGLGLALVRRLLDLHGGVVRVSSEPGKGSTFTVLIRIGGPPRFRLDPDETRPVAAGLGE